MIPISVVLFTLPILSRELGPDRFGLLSLLWAILGYLTLLELGLTTATTKYAAESLALGRNNEVPRIVWTAAVAQAILSIAGATTIVGLTPVLVEHVLNIPDFLREDARSGFYIICLAVPIVIVTGSLSGVLEAAQRFDLVSVVRIISTVLGYLGPVGAISLGLPFPWAVGTIVLAKFTALLVLLVLDVAVFPALATPRLDWGILRKLLTFGGWVAAARALNPALLYLDRFLIAWLLPIAAVGYYTAPFEIVSRLGIISASVASAFFPVFSSMGQHDRLQNIYMRGLRWILALASPLVLGLALFAEEVLRVWLGPDFGEESAGVFRLLLAGGLVGMLAPLANSLLQSQGRPDILPKVYLAEVPLNIGLVWLLVSRAGLAGAAASFLVRAILETGALIYISLKMMNQPNTPSSTMPKIDSRLVVGGSFLILAAALCMTATPSWLPARLGMNLALLVVTCYFCWFHILDCSDRASISALRLWGKPRK
jgi:O-antigen/teichoic acid export membrane protein